MTNIKLKTKGMHCQSCEMLVVDALEELDGVKKAEASFKTGMVSVDFDESKLSKSKIESVIKSEGYSIQ